MCTMSSLLNIYLLLWFTFFGCVNFVSVWLFSDFVLIGCWSFYFKNRKAWTCKVSLCCNWYFQWEKAWRYCSFISQLWCKWDLLLFMWVIFAGLRSNFVIIVFYLQVPHVNRTDYQLIDISEDGFVSFLLLTIL